MMIITRLVRWLSTVLFLSFQPSPDNASPFTVTFTYTSWAPQQSTSGLVVATAEKYIAVTGYPRRGRCEYFEVLQDNNRLVFDDKNDLLTYLTHTTKALRSKHYYQGKVETNFGKAAQSVSEPVEEFLDIVKVLVAISKLNHISTPTTTVKQLEKRVK